MKRKYDESYVEHRYTFINFNEYEIHQCVICSKIVSIESTRPMKSKQYLENVRPQNKDKDKRFFERNLIMQKKMKLGATGTFHETNHKITKTTCVITLKITKQKNTYNC